MANHCDSSSLLNAKVVQLSCAVSNQGHQYFQNTKIDQRMLLEDHFLTKHIHKVFNVHFKSQDDHGRFVINTISKIYISLHNTINEDVI